MITVEKEFDQCVKQIGGIKISDLIGGSPSFHNADYLFNEYNVIAELKCLEDDKIKDDKIRDKASRIYTRHLNENNVPVIVFGKATITTEGFSDEFKREIAELYRIPIHSVIKKANQQIRATKEELKMETAHGLLIIANDGHTALNPANALWVLDETFKRYSFSSIDSIIYFTANLKAEMRGINKSILVWIPSHRSPERKCPEQLLKRLQRNWFKYVESLTGEPIEVIQNFDPNMINDIKNT